MHIHKQEVQNNPILICIVDFLVGPQDLASLCKPGDLLWTWMLGQHAGYFTKLFYIYQAQSSQPSVGFIKPSTNRLHLYQQYTYINNALISTINDHFQVSFPAVSSNSIQCTTPDYICLS